MKIRNVKNKKGITLIVLIITIILMLILARVVISLTLGENGIFNTAKYAVEENESITFVTYSNQDNFLKILVTARDESGIQKMIYRDKLGNELELNCNGKQKVSIDYEIENNGTYSFKIVNENNEILQKELIIDENYRKSLIKIGIQTQIDDGYEEGTKAQVQIDYDDTQINNILEYKVGNDSRWKTYSESFEVDSYTVLKNKWQNEDNTLTIYARKRDLYGNTVLIGQNVEKLDLDMPQEPSVNFINRPKYATLTSSGPILQTKFGLIYEQRDDITNYYSFDKGNTWNQYNDEIFEQVNGLNIYMKSIKNKSGLLIEAKILVEPTAEDAIGTIAYDGNTGKLAWGEKVYNGTYLYWDIKTKTIYCDKSDKNRNLTIWHTGIRYEKTIVYCYNETGTLLSSTTLARREAEEKIYRQTINLPANTTRISISMTQWSSPAVCSNCIYEMRITDK